MRAFGEVCEYGQQVGERSCTTAGYVLLIRVISLSYYVIIIPDDSIDQRENDSGSEYS